MEITNVGENFYNDSSNFVRSFTEDGISAKQIKKFSLHNGIILTNEQLAAICMKMPNTEKNFTGIW
jgi:hypothetical protein